MKNFFGVVMLLIGIATNAQTYLVKGKVSDSHNHAPLQGAEISINGKTMALSNALGVFSFSVKKGQYQLLAQHPDCDAKSENITVNRDLFVEIFLEHHEKELERVVLTGKQKASSVIHIQTLDKDLIEQNSSKNLGNILTEISGVTALKTGNNIAKPIIHGLYGSRILMMNNNVKMAEQEWGVEHAPSVDPNAFETLSIIKGAGALKYGGDAIGGVVVMEQKVFPAKDTLMGSLSATYNTNGRGGNVVLDLAKTWQNRWFVKTQGSYKKMGDLSVPHTTLQNTGTNENALSFSVGNRSFNQGVELYYSGIYQDFGIFKGSHLGSAEDFLKAMNGGATLYTGNFGYGIENPKQEVSHHLAKLEAYKRFNRIGKFSFQYAFQWNHRKEYDIRRGDYNLKPSLDLQLTTHQAQVTHLFERENWKLESGISGSLQNNFPDPITETRRLIPDYKRYDGGVFSVFEYRFNPKFRAELGARYDYNYYDAYKYYDETDWKRFSKMFPQYFVKASGSRILTRPQMGFHNISGNLGINYMPSENFNLKLNFARASRTPNAAELFADGLHHSAAIIERGNLAIKNEVAYQANLLARANFNVLSGLSLEVNPYIMTSENFINQNPSGVLITMSGIFPVWDYQQIKARMYGLDVDAEMKFTENIRWNGQFGMVHGDDLTHNEPLILMMPTNFRNALQLDFPTFKNAYLKAENITFLRQGRFPERIVPLEVIENGLTVQKTIDLTTPPKGYSIWNISAGLDVVKNLRINMGVNNLTNASYREYLNRLRYFADALGRNFYFGLHYKF